MVRCRTISEEGEVPPGRVDILREAVQAELEEMR
jgi:hypothetical protein